MTQRVSDNDLDTECPTNTNEFDTDFIQNNPGVVKSRIFHQQNLKLIGQMDENFSSGFFHINNICNNRLKQVNQGLNINKRGKLKPKDLVNFWQGENLPNISTSNELGYCRKFLPYDELKIQQYQNNSKIQNIFQEIMANNQNLEIQKMRSKEMFEIEESKQQEEEKLRSFNSENSLDSYRDVMLEKNSQYQIGPPQQGIKISSGSQIEEKKFCCEPKELQPAYQSFKPLPESSGSSIECFSSFAHDEISSPNGIQNSSLVDSKSMLIYKIHEVNNSSSHQGNSQYESLNISDQILNIQNISNHDQAQLQEPINQHIEVKKNNSLENYKLVKSKSQRKNSDYQSVQPLSAGSDQIMECDSQQRISRSQQNSQRRVSNPKNPSSNSGKGISQSSKLSWKTKLSMNRKIKMEALKLDYDVYLKIYHGIFVIRCQMMNIEYLKIKNQIKINKMLEDVKKFKRTQSKLKISQFLENKRTIVIDVENTLVTKIDIKSREELENLKALENFTSDYIVIHEPVIDQQCCDKPHCCTCLITVYMVRPYTYEILRAIQQFFELIAFSYLPLNVLTKIITHIEEILFKPMQAVIDHQKNNQENKNKYRRVQVVNQSKLYFSYVIHKRHYLYIEKSGQYVENLLILLSNRLKENIILISSHSYRLVVAKNQGFNAVPVIPFESFYRDDFQLNLLENYLLKNRNQIDIAKQLGEDFKYLVQKALQTKKKSSVIKEGMIYSEESFEKSIGQDQDIKIVSFGNAELEEQKITQSHQRISLEKNDKNRSLDYSELEEGDSENECDYMPKKRSQKSEQKIDQHYGKYNQMDNPRDTLCPPRCPRVQQIKFLEQGLEYAKKEVHAVSQQIENGRVFYDANMVIIEESSLAHSNSLKSKKSFVKVEIDNK